MYIIYGLTLFRFHYFSFNLLFFQSRWSFKRRIKVCSTSYNSYFGINFASSGIEELLGPRVQLSERISGQTGFLRWFWKAVVGGRQASLSPENRGGQFGPGCRVLAVWSCRGRKPSRSGKTLINMTLIVFYKIQFGIRVTVGAAQLVNIIIFSKPLEVFSVNVIR